MKKLVWSEKPRQRRAGPLNGRLPEPPHTTGTFGDLPEQASILAPVDPNKPQIYQDAAVVAYRMRDDATASFRNLGRSALGQARRSTRRRWATVAWRRAGEC